MKLITNLTAKELNIYQSLNEDSWERVSELSTKTKIKRTTIYNFIKKLAQSKLVEHIQINGVDHYKKTYESPNILKFETSNQKDKTLNLITTKRQLKIEIQNTLSCREVNWLVDSQTTTDLLGDKFFEFYIEEANQKSVTLKVLRSPISQGKHRYHDLDSIQKIGRIVRKSQSTIPYQGSIAIFDQKILIISNQKPNLAYLIYDPIINQTMLSIFNGLWKYSKVLGE